MFNAQPCMLSLCSGSGALERHYLEWGCLPLFDPLRYAVIPFAPVFGQLYFQKAELQRALLSKARRLLKGPLIPPPFQIWLADSSWHFGPRRSPRVTCSSLCSLPLILVVIACTAPSAFWPLFVCVALRLRHYYDPPPRGGLCVLVSSRPMKVAIIVVPQTFVSPFRFAPPPFSLTRHSAS